MNMPKNINLATSNISEKEITQIKPGIKGKSTIDFLSLLKSGKKNQKNSGKENLEGGEILGIGMQIPSFVSTGKEIPKKTGKLDLGNRIESGISSIDKKQLDVTKNLLSGKAIGKNILNTEKTIGKKEDLSKIVLKEKSNVLNNSNSDIKNINKKVDLKTGMKELYKIKEEKAVDEGLKVKNLSNKTEIVVAKGNSPQTKGRVFVKNEGKFLTKKSVSKNEGKIISDSEIRKVNTGIKMVGELSYGLKKFKKSIEKEDGKEFSNVHNHEKNFEKFEVKFNKVENQNSARTEFAKIVEQVENGIKMHFNTQLKEMKIKLQPEELGEVDVKLKIENNIMKAEFLVENHTVKEALESKFQLLKDNLEAKGITATEINVYVSTGDGKEKQNRENFELAKKGNFKKIKKVNNLSEKINLIDRQNLRNTRRTNKSSSSLDIFV